MKLSRGLQSVGWERFSLSVRREVVVVSPVQDGFHVFELFES